MDIDPRLQPPPLPPPRPDFHLTLPMDFALLLHSTFGYPQDELRSLSSDRLTIKIAANTAFELYKCLRVKMIKSDSENTIIGPHISEFDDDVYSKIALVSSIYKMIEMESDSRMHKEVEKEIHEDQFGSLKQERSSPVFQDEDQEMISRSRESSPDPSRPFQIVRKRRKQNRKVMACRKKCKIPTTSTSSPQVKVHFSSERKLLTESVRGLSDKMQVNKVMWFNTKIDDALDLHRFNMNDAESELKAFLKLKEQEFVKSDIPEMTLLILTGKGKHSKNGCPILQPAVRRFLIEQQYDFCHHAGLFTVSLTRGQHEDLPCCNCRDPEC